MVGLVELFFILQFFGMGGGGGVEKSELIAFSYLLSLSASWKR